jgi:thiamine kinase-like enzyme
MPDRAHSDIDLETRAKHGAEIARVFGLGTSSAITGPHAHGHQGEVFRLVTDTGVFAVKRSFVPQDQAELADAIEFQRAAHASGVVTPRVIMSTDGRVLVDLEMGSVRVDEWVDLDEPDPTIDAADVGRTIATVHTTHVDRPGERDVWYQAGIGACAWDDLFDRLHEHRAPFVDQLGQQHGELAALDELVVPPGSLQMCHRDLWADNVRMGDDGRIWVIDWNDCGAADPSHELGALLFEYAYEDAGRAAQLYRAYVDAGGPGRVTDARDFSMAIAQLGHILQIACERWLRSTDAADRQVNEGRVAEFIDKPLTRAVIDGLVSALDA